MFQNAQNKELLTNSTGQSPAREANRPSADQEIPLWVLYRIYTSLTHVPLFSQFNPVRAPVLHLK